MILSHLFEFKISMWFTVAQEYEIKCTVKKCVFTQEYERKRTVKKYKNGEQYFKYFKM